VWNLSSVLVARRRISPAPNLYPKIASAIEKMSKSQNGDSSKRVRVKTNELPSKQKHAKVKTATRQNKRTPVKTKTSKSQNR